jgi:LysR family transcriptional regulator, glycine cleavage system transcriptional activator
MIDSRALSLAGLRGFEATARNVSLTKAAAELNLTQSAMSRQVKGLEEELGVALFARGAREITLTAAGATLFAQLQKTLKELDSAVAQLRREAKSPRITITTFASFASLWLIPRLAKFQAANASADLTVSASDRVVDLEGEGFDIAIRLLADEHVPEDAVLLFREHLFPLVSPEYLRTAPRLQSLADLAQHTLIESTAHGAGEQRTTWRGFFEALGTKEIKGKSRLHFDYIAQSMLAAQGGQGVTLARTYGADSYMSGNLVRAFDASVSPASGCYLITSKHTRSRPDVRAFTEWIVAEAEVFNAHLEAWLHPSGEMKKPRRKSLQSKPNS